MKISEKCSCGAYFTIDGEPAIKLVREWRRKHICSETVEARETSLSAYIERTDSGVGDFPIGFRYYPEEDE